MENIPSPGGASDNSPEARIAKNLSGTVDRLQTQLDDLKRLQSSGRSWIGLATLAIVVLFAAFSIGTYRRIHQNFEGDRLRQAVAARSQEMQPMISKLVIETVQEATPAYRDALVNGFQHRGPVMAQDALARFRRVPEENGKMMQEKLQSAFDETLNKLQPDFRAAFPGLSDERRQQILSEYTRQQIDAENSRIALTATSMYTNDLSHMDAVLDRFQLPDPGAPENVVDSASPNALDHDSELEHEFLHTMIELLDDRLNEAYAVAPSEDEQTTPVVASTTQPAASIEPAPQALATVEPTPAEAPATTQPAPQAAAVANPTPAPAPQVAVTPPPTPEISATTQPAPQQASELVQPTPQSAATTQPAPDSSATTQPAPPQASVPQ